MLSGAVSFRNPLFRLRKMLTICAEEWKDEKFKRFGGDLEGEEDDAFGDDEVMDDLMPEHPGDSLR